MTGYVFIVNPEARNGKVGKLWKDSQQRVDELDLDHQTVYSEYQGHAIELSQDVGSKNDIKVAVGGDGTANEVANGSFMSGSPMSIIPLGNGNDYAKNFEFRHDPSCSIDELVKRQPIQASVALVEGEQKTRYAFNVVDVGVSAEVAFAAHTQAKWLPGNSKYTYLALKKLARWKNRPATVTIDGEQHDMKLSLFALGFGRSFGAGFHILPNAAPDHQHLTIVWADSIPRLRMPGLMGKMKEGKHLGRKGISEMTGREVRIETERPLNVDVEGEWGGMTPIDVKAIDQKLTMLVDTDSAIYERVESTVKALSDEEQES